MFLPWNQGNKKVAETNRIVGHELRIAGYKLGIFFVFFLWWKQASIVHRGQTQVEHGRFQALYQLNHLAKLIFHCT